MSACVNTYFPSNFVIRPLQGGTSLLYLDNMVKSSSLAMSFPIVRTFKTPTFHTRSKIKLVLKHSGVRMWKYKYLHIYESRLVQIVQSIINQISETTCGRTPSFMNFEFNLGTICPAGFWHNYFKYPRDIWVPGMGCNIIYFQIPWYL